MNIRLKFYRQITDFNTYILKYIHCAIKIIYIYIYV